MATTSCSLGLACFVLLVAGAGAMQYKVGGDNGWAVPDATAEPFNTWAEKTSFQIGDQLLFVYPKDSDSVLLVEPSDYNSCNTASYDKKFDDGSTSFTLDRSGAFFFISGVDANCRANEKLIVMVAAGANGNSSAPAPAQPSPPPSSTPPAAPSNGSAGAAQAPPNAPAAKNSTAKGSPPGAGNDKKGSPPAAGNDKNGAGFTVAGLVASLVGCTAYAALAF